MIADESAPTLTRAKCLHAPIPSAFTLWRMLIHGHGTGHRFSSGFTVLELMTTLSIVSILLLTGVPSLQQFTLQQNMKAAVASLHNDLMMGRSEAVHLGTRVVSCPGNPADGCSGANNWSDGWIVFADSNADRQRQPGETIFRRGQGLDNLRIHGSTGRTDVRFFPDGSAPGSNGSITFCGLGGPEKARKLVISNTGRIRRDKSPDLDPAYCPT
jgi:type IV fimbrial biogenesis protein FimT